MGDDSRMPTGGMTTMQVYEIKDHEPSLLPEGKNWKPVWSDEFDGTELDRSKWGFRLNFWGRRWLWG
jgi:hypothetical protein